MNHGWPRKVTCRNILPYFYCKAELEFEDGCIYRGHRVVIPTEYRDHMLKELHTSHLGVVKSKCAARSRFWWPSIDKDIESWIGSCAQCASVRSAPPRAPPAPWPAETAPWTRIHIDYLSIGQRTYLVIIDAYSKWLECLFMNRGTSTGALISKLKEIFCTFGIPKVLVSDNDVKIKSAQFSHFCTVSGIRHVTSPIYHPASNGQAENSVRTCKKMLKCILHDDVSQTELNEKFLGYLFQYRNTTHCSTGVSPAMLMLGRELRSRLDLILPDSDCKHRKHNNNSSRQLVVGDVVWLRWYEAKKELWTLGKILNLCGNRMYNVYATDYNVSCRRHIDQLRKKSGLPNVEMISDEKETHDSLPSHSQVLVDDDVTSSLNSPARSPQACSSSVTAVTSEPQHPPLRQNLEEEEDDWAEAQEEAPSSVGPVDEQAGAVAETARPPAPPEPADGGGLSSDVRAPRPVRACRQRNVNYK
ncbi:hypothetical protein JYU34_000165 [Plutella xylostella]|uniref:RNA-directed DNA polymerase n=1 Tax=Plutella xylostella TaxID=51655 RepID=A0ABQ7R700_PLUXY|nr:hypothetical protein JYU34_000165 [Plutella xylostella]